MPQLWYGSDHTGTVHTVKAVDWISFTLNRPTARQAMTGMRPFVVKKVAFKTCAAPSMGQKMYGRLSNPDGSVYDNSYIGNTISWQKAAATTYEFQGINMHFADDGGTKMRAWLVSGGPFYFSTGTGGTTQTTGSKNYPGTPVGYVEYAEVALPPTGLKVARDDSDLNKVNFVWTPWDVKKNFDEVGSTYSVSGYVVQVARDVNFTEKARVLYVSKGKGEVYGLFSGYDWYFRMATRNEVSEHYDLPGGIWGPTVQLVASTAGPDTPSSSSGTPVGATDQGANKDTGTSGSVSDNNPDSTSNQGGASTTETATVTVTENVEEVNTTIKSAKDQISSALAGIQAIASEAHQNPTPTAWGSLNSQLNAVKALATTLSTEAFTAVRPSWVSMVTTVTNLQTKISAAVSAAGAAQSTNQKLDAAKKAAFDAQRTVYDQVVEAKKVATVKNWRDVANALANMNVYVTKGEAVAGSQVAKWTTARTTTNAAFLQTNTLLSKFTEDNREKARLKALAARQAVRDAIDSTPSVATDYSAAEDAVQSFITAITGLLEDTDYRRTIQVTTTKPAGTTTPASGGTSGGANAGGTIPTTTTASGTAEKVVVYTPIPDTTATRTSMGGLLISTSERVSPGHTVYLMDRGGRQRIGEFKSPSEIVYNRIRDDQSLANVKIYGQALRKNDALIDAMAVGRHEICIFRGTERVWEGPLTLATYKADSIELRAHDITHYLNRTVMKNAYTNAYPKIDFVVARIAGIITNELATKESLKPPINVLPYLRTYVEKGDARTTRSTLAAESMVWQHLDDLAAKAGIDYTVIGRALHIWDTSRPAMGQLRTVTQDDFLGDTYIAAYGMETATQTFVTDGQGNYGQAGGVDDFYGEIDLLATAYDENGNAVNQEDTDPTNDTVPIEEMTEQAGRNLKGRNPTPLGLKVPDNSSFRLDRGLGLDVLIPGVYIPVSATVAGRRMNQIMKLKEIKVTQNEAGESATLTLTPAAASDVATEFEDAG